MTDPAQAQGQEGNGARIISGLKAAVAHARGDETAARMIVPPALPLDLERPSTVAGGADALIAELEKLRPAPGKAGGMQCAVVGEREWANIETACRLARDGQAMTAERDMFRLQAECWRRHYSDAWPQGRVKLIEERDSAQAEAQRLREENERLKRTLDETWEHYEGLNPAQVDDRLADAQAEARRLRDALTTAIQQIGALAREARETKGRLEASEIAGVVEGWRDRALKAEMQLEHFGLAAHP